jgi:hypothetical protein
MKEIRNRSFAQLIEAASRQMAEKVIERAKASGTPVIIWENGKVKEVDPNKWKKSRRNRFGNSV